MRLPFVMMIIASVAFLLSAQDAGRGGQPKGGAAPVMILTIPGFPDGGHVPVKFSQAAPGVPAGEGTSPAMQWANAPSGTQSFVLYMHDMDLTRNKPATIKCLGFVKPFVKQPARKYFISAWCELLR